LLAIKLANVANEKPMHLQKLQLSMLAICKTEETMRKYLEATSIE
jgi:hypothetical protein